MHRRHISFLEDWMQSKQRKPLVIRGARQVGKTWLVRCFAQLQKLSLIEINLEKQPYLASLFASNNPNEILTQLSSYIGRGIDPMHSVLFLDEIQAAPELLAKLRWFYEDMPELAVIAAGSLLEFTLENHTFSMPVGRINYMHLEPLSFEEFLQASGNELLVKYLAEYMFTTQIPQALHEKLIRLFKEYIIIGGMPAAVFSWIQNRSLTDVGQVHLDLLATYRDDFAKYCGRIDTDRLEDIVMAVPRLLGAKFMYSRVNPHVHSSSLKKALDLLCKAKVCHRVSASYANGIPLGSESHSKYFKVVFLDTGLCTQALGLTLSHVTNIGEITLINRGAIAEQVVAQCLRTIFPPYMPPMLYYWQREQAGAQAEVDYVIQHENQVIPVEVKAGTTGSLKSLHYFMDLKQYKKAIRINSDLPSQVEVNVQDHQGKEITYTLISLPFYLIGQLQRLLTK